MKLKGHKYRERKRKKRQGTESMRHVLEQCKMVKTGMTIEFLWEDSSGKDSMWKIEDKEGEKKTKRKTYLPKENKPIRNKIYRTVRQWKINNKRK